MRLVDGETTSSNPLQSDKSVFFVKDCVCCCYLWGASVSHINVVWNVGPLKSCDRCDGSKM